MRLWTFQPVELVHKVVNEGYTYRCDASLSYYLTCDFDFGFAYDWLAEQMDRRVSRPENTVYPVWAYYHVFNEHKKPDLRTSMFKDYDSRSAVVELEIPAHRVVLSSFIYWTDVLNKWASVTEETERQFNYDDDAIFEYCSTMPEEQKRKTWEQSVFNVTQHSDTEYYQATFWEMRPSDVVRVHPIHRLPNEEPL